MQRSILAIGLVFGLGLSGGFAWRQGWIAVLPPETGVLDEAESSPAAALETSAPLAEFTGSEAEAPVVRFEGLTEPTPQTAPLTAPRVVTRPAPLSDVPATRVPISDAVIPAAAVEHANSQPLRSAFAQFTTAAEPVETLPAQAPADDRESILAEHKELSRIYWREPERRAEIQARIDETARLIFIAPQPHFVEPHVIQPGDRLDAIAAKHKLTWEYLSKLNQVDPKRIRAGQRLKLVRGPFSAVVELADYSLTVHLQGYYVKRYAVGVGKDGSTPLGKFPVLNKVVNPQYTDPAGKVIDGDDPENPLGERWIDLGNSYGIHGTIDPNSIGRAASRGCIRLRDADIIEVYDFLVMGSEVAIR